MLLAKAKGGKNWVGEMWLANCGGQTVGGEIWVAKCEWLTEEWQRVENAKFRLAANSSGEMKNGGMSGS